MRNNPILETLKRVTLGSHYATALYGVIVALYKSPSRAYHNIHHVNYMFNAAETLGWELSVHEALAVVFHDCVYVPLSSDNEKRSAEVMLGLLRPYGDIHEDPRRLSNTLNWAADIVRDTAHFLEPDLARPFSQRVMDLDLMSLATTDKGQWMTDRRNIELELGTTPKLTAQFFSKLMERPRIFMTDGLDRFELRARENMQGYIDGV